MRMLDRERRRVLLIDENSRRLNLLATILRNHEVEVHPASRLDDARTLWKNIPYDLVLLAAPENSEQATVALLQIRKISPQQRIALLVGPPAYIREIARPAGKAQISPAALPSASVGESPLLKPQGPEIIQKVVSDWYVDQHARFALSKLAAPAGELPYLAD